MSCNKSSVQTRGGQYSQGLIDHRITGQLKSNKMDRERTFALMIFMSVAPRPSRLVYSDSSRAGMGPQ